MFSSLSDKFKKRRADSTVDEFGRIIPVNSSSIAPQEDGSSNHILATAQVETVKNALNNKGKVFPNMTNKFQKRQSEPLSELSSNRSTGGNPSHHSIPAMGSSTPATSMWSAERMTSKDYVLENVALRLQVRDLRAQVAMLQTNNRDLTLQNKLEREATLVETTEPLMQEIRMSHPGVQLGEQFMLREIKSAMEDLDTDLANERRAHKLTRTRFHRVMCEHQELKEKLEAANEDYAVAMKSIPKLKSILTQIKRSCNDLAEQLRVEVEAHKVTKNSLEELEKEQKFRNWQPSTPLVIPDNANLTNLQRRQIIYLQEMSHLKDRLVPITSEAKRVVIIKPKKTHNISEQDTRVLNPSQPGIPGTMRGPSTEAADIEDSHVTNSSICFANGMYHNEKFKPASHSCDAG